MIVNAATRLSQGGNWSTEAAASGCQAMPMPSTAALPSQNVSPARKQILATSIAFRPQAE